jgi:hypothetical protein
VVKITEFTIKIKIPGLLARLLVWSVLFYRRLRYGYAFRRIPLTQGKFAIVDPEDFERLNKQKWFAAKCRNLFYAGRNVRIGKSRRRLYIKMHREIIDPPFPFVVDHINHNGLDNRKANLRPVTRAQNSLNRLYFKPGSSSSKYKGVHWHKYEKRWQAQICFNGKRKTIGYFDDETEAAKAYDEAARKFHKEFANLNFKS